MTLDEQFLLPLSLREQYYRDGHWRSEDLWTSFDAIASARAEAVALVDGGRRITFAELRREAERFGRALRTRGIASGQVVVVHGRHCIESSIAILGCAHAGAIVALLPHMFSTEQIRAILGNSEARVLVALGEPTEVVRASEAVRGLPMAGFVVADSAGTVEGSATAWSRFLDCGDSIEAPHDPERADDLALLMFSSGTTGEPKGVMHSSNTIRFSVETYTRHQSIDASDTSLVVTAFGFIGSSVLGTYLTYLCGCRTVLQRSWDPDEMLALVEKHKVTHFLLMPTHAIDILTSPRLAKTDCSSVSRGVVAGINEVHRFAARARLCARPYPMYGMSESPAHVTGGTNDELDHLRTTEGKAIPGTELRICDDDDHPVPPGTHGNILVRGPNRFLGYFRNEPLNRASLTAQGFFRTGDVGFIDEAGFLTFVTRSKDIIRRGGVTITPADIEAALRPHPRISDVAIIGLPDPRLGERACACVITRDGQDISLHELTDFLATQAFARYLWPESAVTCASFPRTPSLKVQKNELRRQILARG
jgi:acyl-CoA synthetase (AMP-forming)/AMP-acid ligase II